MELYRKYRTNRHLELPLCFYNKLTNFGLWLMVQGPFADGTAYVCSSIHAFGMRTVRKQFGSQVCTSLKTQIVNQDKTPVNFGKKLLLVVDVHITPRVMNKKSQLTPIWEMAEEVERSQKNTFFTYIAKIFVFFFCFFLKKYLYTLSAVSDTSAWHHMFWRKGHMWCLAK